jgi:hypothetical protein
MFFSLSVIMIRNRVSSGTGIYAFRPASASDFRLESMSESDWMVKNEDDRANLEQFQLACAVELIQCDPKREGRAMNTNNFIRRVSG